MEFDLVRKLLIFVLSFVVISSAYAELFVDSFESGELKEERWQIDMYQGCKIEHTAEPTRNGEQSIRFMAALGTRCEIIPKFGNPLLWRLLHEPFNEERWYSFSLFLPKESEFAPGNEVVAQWHSARDKFIGEKSGRGPPLALRIQDGNWRVTYGWDSDFLSKPGHKAIYPLWENKVDTGVWVDWVFRVRWSYEDDGYIDIWKNGTQVVKHRGPNAYNDLRGVYLKLGSYHPTVNRVIYFDNIRLGDEDETFGSIVLKGSQKP
jgi:Polysaccharide lyase